MGYKIKIVSEPYHYYERDQEVQSLLTKIFCNQLLGYKAYYPVGICPISEYDFFTNHVAILDDNTSEVLCSYKITDLNICRLYGKEFPISSVIGDHLPEHKKVVGDWLNAHPNAGYNHSWTINPSIQKDQKKELVDITFAILASFYMDRSIMNIIDISIMPFKIHLIKEWMGNSYLEIPPFEVKEYDNKLGCIMVNEGLQFSSEFRFMIKKYSKLWEEREEFNPSDYELDIAA